MTSILGISAFYHDSAAAIIVDGQVIAAAQEERFTRNKHDESFPTNAIEYCLKEAGIKTSELDYVAFYEKPLLKFDRILESYLSYAPRGFRSFMKATPLWVNKKLHLRREIRNGLEGYQGNVLFCEHHQSHAASAFYPSPFDKAAILTVDGVGEWATTTLGIGDGNKIELTNEIRFPHSIGLLYSAFTAFTGFRVNSGEYKLMGLAPYGEPKHVDAIYEHLIDLKEDGSFRLDMDYFGYGSGLRMTTRKFHDLFGRKPRTPESKIEQLDMNMAASVQVVTEEIVLRCAKHLHEQTGAENLCMAGGVALNCVANGKLTLEGPFKNIWIQPAAGDAGGALGAAWFVWHQLLDQKRDPKKPDNQTGSLLGPEFDTEQAQHELTELGGVYQRIAEPEQLFEETAGHLANGKVVGWMSGRMEFGPRALGSRSILGDPRVPDMQSKMNLKIKFRESFRPFAPSVLSDHAADYFAMPDEMISPYMLLVYNIHEKHRCEPEPSAPEGLEQVNNVRSSLPAITHVDYSARVQTIDRDHHPRYHRLLEAFYKKTSCPVLINTSFNVRDEPIICSPSDAYRCFMATDMDVLVVGDLVLQKEEQPKNV